MNAKDDLKSIPQPSVEIYTDGGCEPNPGPGGYCAALIHPKKRAEVSGGFRKCEIAYHVESAKRFVEQTQSLL